MVKRVNKRDFLKMIYLCEFSISIDFNPLCHISRNIFFSNCFKYFVQSSSKRAEVRFLQCNHFIPSTERYFFAISPKGLRGSNPLQDAFASRPCRHKPPSICLTKRKKGSQASAPSFS